jgi:hypothetical protein
MNQLPRGLHTGTVGELLVQLRLLEAGVQAAAPLKDSGNDLIAIKGTEFRAIQVKACVNARPPIRRGDLPALYHLLALVELRARDGRLALDDCTIYLLTKSEVDARSHISWNDSRLTTERINMLFAHAI